MVPYKRTFATAGVIFSGVTSWFIRRALLEWAPTASDLLTNQYAIAYVVLSFLIGLAIMYYRDSDSDHKMHVILRCGMQLLGCFLVYLGTNLPQQCGATYVILFLTAVLPVVRRTYTWLGNALTGRQTQRK